ncbi:50S ribosomal subunit protein L1 [Candidatus Vidania fulgoroideae]|nr:50S ribosomal subunit protein L1 [Candidatus Vidania fulgoroideae]
MFDKKKILSFFKKKYNFIESFDVSLNIKNKFRIINSGFLCLPNTFRKKVKTVVIFNKSERIKDKIKLINVKFLEIENNKTDINNILKYYEKKYTFILTSFSNSFLGSFSKEKSIKKILKKSFFFKENYENNIRSLSEGKIVKYKFDSSNSIKFSFANSSMSEKKILSNLKKSVENLSIIFSNININFKKDCKIFLNTTQSKKSFLLKSYE